MTDYNMVKLNPITEIPNLWVVAKEPVAVCPPNMLRYRLRLLADEHRAGQSFYTKPSDLDLLNTRSGRE